ncbi:uncharacterized protein CDAR_120911 [Caerostris darwini]|uniref:Mutator-like transposase domain-containing protein n=1 Tax=Caerostris darwini TaxID=1538125 RepID=A0AAV4QCR6_9ARAC|nr:uncharacterized protein CDAR_120911 [Caerostris darwini]
MDRKSSKFSSARPCRSKKRKFSNNQVTVEEETSFTSASAAKLKHSQDEEVIINNNYGYCILEFFSVFTTLSTLILCSTCKKEIKFSRAAARGLGFKIALQCECEQVRYIQSSPFINKPFEVNRRIVAAMRLLGVGREGINIFCSIMDICQGLTIRTYYSCLDNLHTAASAVYDQIISRAVREEKELLLESDPQANPNHLTVSGDGTWKKRGFNSLFGVTTLVGKYSKKVVDTIVKSSFCQGCNVWKHKKNYDIEAYLDWYKEHEELVQVSEGNRRRTIDEFDHKNPPLNDKVLEVIKPIYESLSADSLLERCLGSETQNNNESLNSLIWTFAPKHIHAGPKTIEIATFFAVSIFNEGFIPILKILDVMGITIGPEANAFAARRDEARIERSELRTSEASKEGRTARLHQRTSENEHFEVKEGFLYEAGIAD